MRRRTSTILVTTLAATCALLGSPEQVPDLRAQTLQPGAQGCAQLRVMKMLAETERTLPVRQAEMLQAEHTATCLSNPEDPRPFGPWRWDSGEVVTDVTQTWRWPNGNVAFRPASSMWYYPSGEPATDSLGRAWVYPNGRRQQSLVRMWQTPGGDRFETRRELVGWACARGFARRCEEHAFGLKSDSPELQGATLLKLAWLAHEDLERR